MRLSRTTSACALAAFSALIFALPLAASASVTLGTANTTSLLSGLVGYWTFDGGTISGTTARDSSGQGNNGTLVNGPVPVIGKIGQALKFNGTATAVNLGGSTSFNFPNTTFTVSTWFKSSASSYQILVSSEASNVQGGWSLEMNNCAGTVGLDVKSSAGGDAVEPCTAASYNDNNWHLATAVVTTSTVTPSGNTVAVYVDGIYKIRATASTLTYGSPASPTIYIGKRNSVAGNIFNGIIDDVRIYNRALSAQEVQQLYLMGK